MKVAHVFHVTDDGESVTVDGRDFPAQPARDRWAERKGDSPYTFEEWFVMEYIQLMAYMHAGVHYTANGPVLNNRQPTTGTPASAGDNA